MAPKKSFKKAYVGIVMDMALARSKISNRMVAQRLGVDEITIRRWRKENPDLDRAFTEAKEMLMEKINDTAVKSLSVRKRKVVIDGPKGRTVQVEEVLPTYNDVAVFGKALGMGHTIHSEEDRQRDILRDVMKRKVSGEYTALEAAQLLEGEGIEVPKTLLMEIAPSSKTSAGWLTLKNGESVTPGAAQASDFSIRFVGMQPTEPAKPNGDDDGNSAE